MTHEENPLIEVVAAIVDKRRDTHKISPSWVATEAMLQIDPDNASPHLVRLGCHLELRQIARGILRKRFDPGEEDGPQSHLFVDLQWRYPTARSLQSKEQEAEYVLRDHMLDEDIEYNVSRLRAESLAKLKHADALEAWGSRRKRAATR